MLGVASCGKIARFAFKNGAARIESSQTAPPDCLEMRQSVRLLRSERRRAGSVDLATLTALPCCILEARNSLEPFGRLNAVVGERLPSGEPCSEAYPDARTISTYVQAPGILWHAAGTLRLCSYPPPSVSEHANRRNASPPRRETVRRSGRSCHRPAACAIVCSRRPPISSGSVPKTSLTMTCAAPSLQ